MKTAGIICEYNPFHNGHLYHINKTKETADAVICIMSGNFVQRGGPAFCDKFSRARAAAICGADLVIELPAVFASRSAEYFAKGAVSILDACGVVDYLSYGCESDDVCLIEETEEYKTELSRILDSGLSFPAARFEAAKRVFGITLSDKPNDILAYEYHRALKNSNSKIEPLPVKRMFQEYHSLSPEGTFASAAYIRQNTGVAQKYMPSPAYEIINKANISDSSIYEIMVLSHLRTITPEELSVIADCNEGLENRIISSAHTASSYEELINLIKTKRYTRGRIERIIANSLLGIDKTVYHPEYLRVLSMNNVGTKLLREISKKSGLPVITNLSKQKIPSKQLDIDIKSGNLFALLTEKKSAGTDFKISPAVINKDNHEYN